MQALQGRKLHGFVSNRAKLPCSALRRPCVLRTTKPLVPRATAAPETAKPCCENTACCNSAPAAVEEKKRPAPPAASKKKAAAATGPTHLQLFLQELAKPKDAPGRKKVVVQIAPAVRVAISEAFGLAPGTITIGQIVTGLKQLGCDYVLDTLFGADLTIMEEAHELLHRLTAHLEQNPNQEQPMPMFTSCCPGWVEMVEKSYPEIIPYLSSCKSPQMMMAAVIKRYFSSELGVKPSDVSMCSIMPCLKKQGEADRKWFATDDSRDVDHVVTTAELAALFAERNVPLAELPESKYDNHMWAEGSGGAQLFGTTGGVMEAALRLAYEAVTGQTMGRVVFNEVRGLDGIKEAVINMKPVEGSTFAKYDKGEGLNLRIAVANGLGSAKKLVVGLKEGSSKYDFIEVMACPGGCIGGGGQPRSKDRDILKKRQAAMYDIDERLAIRRTQDNPWMKRLYEKYLGAPNSHLAHEVLHTHYIAGGPDGKKQ